MRRFLLTGFIAGAAMACTLVRGVPSPAPSSAAETTPAAATAMPAATSAEPGTETSASPTPIQGPTIAHLAAGQAFDVGVIQMMDPSRGWAIGGLAQAQDHVFRTETGGQTWRDVTPPEPAPAAGAKVEAVGSFKDAATAWVVYGPADGGDVPPGLRVWRTADGGGSWSYGVIDTTGLAQESFVPDFLDFSDAQDGWLLVVLGAGMNHEYSALFGTADGGKTWTDLQDPTTPAEIQSFPKTGMTFFDSQTGWLTRDGNGVDPSPHVIRTQDGGVTWTRIDLPEPQGSTGWFDQNACGTYAPTALSAQSLLVLLKCEDNATFKIEHDYLYATADAGATWQSLPMPGQYEVGGTPDNLYFVNTQSGLALGREIYRTDDGGKTWSSAKQVNWDGTFSFVDLSSGWAVARNAGQIALVKTSDGGKSWVEIHPTVIP